MGIMDTPTQLPNNQILDPLADVELIGRADRSERAMPVVIELGAHVFAIEGQSGQPCTVSSRRRFQCS